MADRFQCVCFTLMTGCGYLKHCTVKDSGLRTTFTVSTDGVVVACMPWIYIPDGKGMTYFISKSYKNVLHSLKS